MFKKKTPVPPYILEVLTTEYLIDGTVDGDTRLYFPKAEMVSPPIELNTVKIQTTRPVDIPAQYCEQFVLVGDNLVALIPRIEIDQLKQYLDWLMSDKPLMGTFYVAHYKISGKLMFLRKGFFEDQMHMLDVHISSLAQGTHWGELDAPFILLNTQWLHGYAPGEDSVT